MKKTTITESELLTELEKYRPKLRVDITPEQQAILRAAREHEKPVTYIKLAEFWKDHGWGEINENEVRKICIFYKIGAYNR